MACQARTSRHARTHLATCGYSTRAHCPAGHRRWRKMLVVHSLTDFILRARRVSCDNLVSQSRSMLQLTKARVSALQFCIYPAIHPIFVRRAAARRHWGCAPLLVEVRNAFRNTAIPNIADSCRVTSPVAGTALTARDDPVQALKVERVDGTKQLLGADEADGYRHLAQVVRAPRVVVRLHRIPDPDVRRPGPVLAESGEALPALG